MNPHCFIPHKRKWKLLIAAIGAVGIFTIAWVAYVLFRANADTPIVLAAATAPDRIKIGVDDLPPRYEEILLRVEDPNFYSHHGVDVTTPGAGWTTITQAIVKVYFYDGFTPGVFRYRKIEQTLIAVTFDYKVDKRTQLLIFINSAYFGNLNGREVIGFEDAAETYFHKRVSDLARDEFVALVAMLVAPNDFSVVSHPDRNQDRVNRIERLLAGDCKPTGLSDVLYDSCEISGP